ncbi:MAG: response regulator transcription factor [Bacteroidales bacterium]|nr:response regulator transcription factor [Bacteroidales bacterium]
MTPARPTILVVDDEPDLLEILEFNLEAAGYEVRTARSAAEALEQDPASADLLLLDVMMPGMDGFALARRLRAEPATAALPIVFLTARDSEADVVAGLELGGDDYISKPFSIKEVLARVAAVLRRAQRGAGAPAAPAQPSTGLALDLETKTVTIDGAPVPFTRTEFDLLRLLLEQPGRVFSRGDLLARAWPEDVIVTERTVDVNITRIRKKLGHYAAQLRTRSGFGYYFAEE